MSKLRDSLTGISGILVTPFDQNDELEMPKLRPIIDKAVDAGVHILVSNGNTGEFYALTTDEAEAAVRATAEMIDGRVPLLAGIGRSIKDACRLAKTSAEAGADALMIHQPPDPFVAPRGIVDYVKRVHEASGGLPMMLYLRNDTIGLKAIEQICAIEGVAGVKWATPNPMKLSEAIRATDPGITWVNGLAEVWAPPLYAVGARGFTSGLINMWPEQSVAIHKALDSGDFLEAGRLIAQMSAFEEVRAEEMNGTNVSGVKAALSLMDMDCGAARAPAAWPLTEVQTGKISALLDQHGLLRRAAA